MLSPSIPKSDLSRRPKPLLTIAKLRPPTGPPELAISSRQSGGPSVSSAGGSGGRSLGFKVTSYPPTSSSGAGPLTDPAEVGAAAPPPSSELSDPHPAKASTTLARAPAATARPPLPTSTVPPQVAGPPTLVRARTHVRIMRSVHQLDVVPRHRLLRKPQGLRASPRVAYSRPPRNLSRGRSSQPPRFPSGIARAVSRELPGECMTSRGRTRELTLLAGL